MQAVINPSYQSGDYMIEVAFTLTADYRLNFYGYLSFFLFSFKVKINGF